jgi:hypothetical protein
MTFCVIAAVVRCARGSLAGAGARLERQGVEESPRIGGLNLPVQRSSTTKFFIVGGAPTGLRAAILGSRAAYSLKPLLSRKNFCALARVTRTKKRLCHRPFWDCGGCRSG